MWAAHEDYRASYVRYRKKWDTLEKSVPSVLKVSSEVPRHLTAKTENDSHYAGMYDILLHFDHEFEIFSSCDSSNNSIRKRYKQ